MSADFLKSLLLPCGGQASFDVSSGIGYRCETCNAVLGSIRQPRACKEEDEKYRTMKILGSKVRWDYVKGEEVFDE